MKYFHNQKGYALLLVLLMITLFIGVAALITTASFNHSKQESTVDTKNQVVVAAEMGVKYYSTEIQSIAGEIRRSIMIDTVQPLLDSYEIQYNSCNDSGFSTTACDKYRSLTAFVTYVNTLGTSIFKSDLEDEVVYLVDSNDITQQLGFDLLEINPTVNENNKILFTVEGNLNDTVNDEKVINSELTVNVPNFLTTHQNLNESPSDVDQWNAMLLTAPFAEQSCYPVNMLTAPYICNMGNNSLQEIINSGASQEILNQLIVINSTNSDLCSKSGNCGIDMQGITVYNQTSVNLGQNFNNTSNGTFYNYGNFFVDNNLQNLDANIVTTSIDVKNFKNITGNVLILGTPEKTGIANFQNVSVNDGGKLCLNLDGLSSFSFSQLNGNNDQIILYSKNKTSQFGRPIFPGSYQQFLQSCSPQDINLPFPSIEDNEFDIIVNYD